ncbi:MAG: hormogonium polysaccharide secretion pseudopilin HpsC [Scytonema sp. PMC 1069.18]|nr:hormogonium polysaccharide secretion pseudopilin HpsC [Scytonema sp. PMC 1069.18]MEC4886997.1 hormogonium polysaccharide secretion pseudopilin HpsC [Scytonema sp. PMC 1070.18]
MLSQIHFFLYTYIKLKRLNLNFKNQGFTLIEILVALALAVLVITPLLGFMINILDTDRKEQAKTTTEQEIQTALDYIAQELQQAIYIYDAKGIKAIKNELPYPDETDKVPVLVFWKRQFESEVIDVKVGGSSKGKNDSYVYSLVIYYLMKNTGNTWSNQFRIARLEIKDGVRDLDNPTKPDGTSNYITSPTKGFQLFDLSKTSGTLEEKMNAWKKNTTQGYESNTKTPPTLIDYIDKSKDSALQPIDCTTVFENRAVTDSSTSEEKDKAAALKVPAFDGTHQYSTLTDFNNGSFYACVDADADSDKITAKIFIRGNALARIDENNNTYNAYQAAYFPTVGIQVKGRGRIGVE